VELGTPDARCAPGTWVLGLLCNAAAQLFRLRAPSPRKRLGRGPRAAAMDWPPDKGGDTLPSLGGSSLKPPEMPRSARGVPPRVASRGVARRRSAWRRVAAWPRNLAWPRSATMGHSAAASGALRSGGAIGTPGWRPSTPRTTPRRARGSRPWAATAGTASRATEGTPRPAGLGPPGARPTCTSASRRSTPRPRPRVSAPPLRASTRSATGTARSLGLQRRDRRPHPPKTTRDRRAGREDFELRGPLRPRRLPLREAFAQGGPMVAERAPAAEHRTREAVRRSQTAPPPRRGRAEVRGRSEPPRRHGRRNAPHTRSSLLFFR